jgi:hypothetical protein
MFYELCECLPLGAEWGNAPRSVLRGRHTWVTVCAATYSDLFDAGFKANLRNIGLLEKYQLDPQGSRRGNRWFMVGVTALLGCLVAALIAIPVLLLVGLMRLF